MWKIWFQVSWIGKFKIYNSSKETQEVYLFEKNKEGNTIIITLSIEYDNK